MSLNFLRGSTQITPNKVRSFLGQFWIGQVGILIVGLKESKPDMGGSDSKQLPEKTMKDSEI